MEEPDICARLTDLCGLIREQQKQPLESARRATSVQRLRSRSGMTIPGKVNALF